MTTPRALVAGNWKMNGLRASVSEISHLNDLISTSGANCDVLICPPFTLISTLVELGAKNVQIGAQDCHKYIKGAHTGDISAEMIADLNASHIIVGHSERRADHDEDDKEVSIKATAAHDAGTIAIICVGETLQDRNAGNTLNIVSSQVRGSIPETATPDNTIIAYEPVWAIGTGKVPTAKDVAEVHKVIREILVDRFGQSGNSVKILYGGSVKASNAEELMSVPNVNGALVGGASLKAKDFYGIISAYDKIG